MVSANQNLSFPRCFTRRRFFASASSRSRCKSALTGIGTIVAAKKMSGTTAYYQYAQYDHRGSVSTLTDKSGAVVASYLYDAWGNILNSTERVAVEAVGNRFKYQSNWMYLRERIHLSPARVKANSECWGEGKEKIL